MEIVKTTEVAAPAHTLWQALLDVESWPQWTDSMESVELLDGPVRVGATARVKQPKLAPAIFTVDEMDDDASFVWSARTGGITSVGGHYVKPLSQDRSELRLVFTQSGLLAPVMGLLLRKRIDHYVELELNGLRRCAEASAAGG